MAALKTVRGFVLLPDDSSEVSTAGWTVRLLRRTGLAATEVASTPVGADGRWAFDLAKIPNVVRSGLAYEFDVLDGRTRIPITGDVSWTTGAGEGPRMLVAVPPVSPSAPAETPDYPDPETPPALYGQVTHADGSPCAGVVVALSSVNPFEDTPVGSTSTSTQGWFRFDPEEGSSLPADFLLRATAPVGGGEDEDGRALGASGAVYGATFPLRVDIVTRDTGYQKPSEYSRVSEKLSPLVTGGALDALGTRGVAVLVGKSGLAPEIVGRWLSAQRLAATLDTDPATWAEHVYGLMALGGPANFDALKVRSRADVASLVARAREKNTISKSAADGVTGLLAALRDAGIAHVKDTARHDSLGSILTVGDGGLTSDQVADFVELHADAGGATTAFWTALAGKPHFDGDTAAQDEAKRRVRLGMIGLGWAPVVERLLAELDTADASAVGTFTLAQWNAIAADVTPLPHGLEGVDETAQRATLARTLRHHARMAYPSIAAKAHLAGFNTHLDTFFSANPAFDLRTSRVDGHPKDDDDAKRTARAVQRLFRIAPTSDPGPAIAALYSAGYTSSRAVARHGSARFAATMADTLEPDVVASLFANAQRAHGAATVQAMQLATSAAMIKANVPFLPVDPATDPAAEVDDWDALFGPTSFCACTWCNSVTGPAAYLVDLLYWLDERQTIMGDNPLDHVLLTRRPDLATLPLTCDNTNTALPYIDLVLEVLEDIVASSTVEEGELTLGSPSPHSTTAATEELLARPEHTQTAAYNRLANTDNVRTFHTPFLQPLEELRIYLRHLGVDRAALMRAVSGFDATPAAPTDLQIAYEELGTSEEYWGTVVASSTTLADEGAYWPEELSSDVTSDANRPRALMRSASLTWDQVLDLIHTRYVNPRSGADLSTTTLSFAFTDPSDLDTYTLVRTSGASALTASDWRRIRSFLRLSRITGWTFLELDRVLGVLGISDLTSLADAHARALGDLVRVSRRTGRPPLEIATWKADALLDTWRDRESATEPVPSWYDTVILNPSLFTTDERELGTFALDESRTEILNPSAPVVLTILDAQNTLAAVLGVDVSEVAGLQTALVPSNELTLASLSLLYRWASIARSLGIKPTDAFALSAVTGIDPTNTFAEAATFVEDLRAVSAAGWTPDELRYVLDHSQADRVGPTEGRLQQVLGRTRDAIVAIVAQAASVTDERSVMDTLVRVVADGLGVDRTTLAGWQDLTWPHVPPLPTDDFPLLGASPTGLKLKSGAVRVTRVTLPAGTAFSFAGVGSGVLAAETAVDLATGVDIDVPSPTPGLRITLAPGTPWHCDNSGSSPVASLAAGTVVTLGEDGPDATLGATVQASLATSATLSDDRILPAGTRVTLTDTATVATVASGTAAIVRPPGADLSALPTTLAQAPLYRLLRATFATAGTGSSNPYEDLVRTESTFADDFAMLDVLAKAVVVRAKLGLDADELAFWNSVASPWTVLPPVSLAGAGVSVDWSPLRELIVLFSQRARLPGTTPSFGSLLADVGTDGLVGDLSARTGWASTDIQTFLTAMLGGSPTLASGSGWQAFLDAMLVARTSGASADVVLGWRVPPSASFVSSDLANSAVTAARSRYATASAWATVARPIRDVLRKRQRDVLVAWILQKSNLSISESVDRLADAEALYEYLLLDVSMNPEMLTSRIKQAACSVQLFIHRCMFGLELNGAGDPVMSFTDADREQWEWMRTYRVWEAARKVFLYPENYIEPELRDDKSEFFVELEQALAQGDVTAEHTEQAVLDYVDKLHGVATLEILACYQQSESFSASTGGDAPDDINHLHIFARTRSSPPTYWYRRREDGVTWTPWAQNKAGVVGDTLVPYLYDRRLFLFWPEFTTVSSEGTKSTNDAATGTEITTNEYASKRVPVDYWEIRLAMSEFRDGKWQPKRLAEPTIHTTMTPTEAARHDDPSTYLFVASESDGSLQLALHYRGNVDTTSGEYEDDNAPTATFSADQMQKGTSYLVGSFVLDLATQEISTKGGTPNQDSTSIIAGDGLYFQVPGFHAGPDGGDFSTILAFPGADGASPATTVLAGFVEGNLVVPLSTAAAFDVQTPFVVRKGKRVYVGDPLVSALESSAADAIVNSLSDHRVGTSATTGPDAITDDEVDMAGAYARGGRSSDDDARNGALRRTGTTMARMTVSTNMTPSAAQFAFHNLYHPFSTGFLKEARRDGIFALLDPDPDSTEQLPKQLFRQQVTTENDFLERLDPNDEVVQSPYPPCEISFDYADGYASYNWELFFHIPLYVASRLAAERRFQEALDWLHCMFDPRCTKEPPAGYPAASKWWKIKPFLEAVSAPVTDWDAFTGSAGSVERTAFDDMVAQWMDDPFNPHLLARLRPGTYQKALVMRYLDTIIAWGDQLFAQDTIEALNEATQLYVFVKQVLGDRPVQLAPVTEPEPFTYADLRTSGALDSFGNAVVTVEEANQTVSSGRGSTSSASSSQDSVGYTALFCVPFNDKLLGYWDTVDDRLFKLRNGLNLKGIRRTLPLFEPPIDPMSLVRATAAGVDIGTATGSGGRPGPHRYSVLVARAQSLAASARGLGQALLGALEKQDAEALSLLRGGHELALLDQVRNVKEMQIEDAVRAVDALQAQRHTTEKRLRYYAHLIEKRWLPQETAAAALTLTAAALDLVGISGKNLSAIFSIIPQAVVGVCSGAEFGGQQLSKPVSEMADAAKVYASVARAAGGHLTTTAAYARRAQEWQFQHDQATAELAQLDTQIGGALIRVEIARKELSNHDLQRRQSQEVQDFLTSKFTNGSLYQWMVGQISSTYFQSYQLALDVAQKAQLAYNYELGRSDSFLQAVYWDSMRQGLYAAERLSADLDRMDAAWLDNNQREFELTRVVSLNRLDPFALERLRTLGECWFTVPEALYDLDAAGHYFRRIQAVTLTITSVAGPSVPVHAELRLLSSTVRTSPDLGGEGTADTTMDAMVTSTAQDDGGMFTFDMKDARYLPFERRGVASTWYVRLLSAVSVFDPASITDVSLRIRYTARDGGDQLRSAAKQQVFANLADTALGFGAVPADGGGVATGLAVGFLASRDFPDELFAAQTDSVHTFTAMLSLDLFPYVAQALANPAIRSLYVLSASNLAAATGATIGDEALSPGTDPVTGLTMLGAPAVSVDLVTDGPTLTLTLPSAPDDLFIIAVYGEAE